MLVDTTLDRTNTGLAQDVIALYGRMLALKLLPRTGWLQRGVPMVESIAEHSFGVASLALIVGDLETNIDRGRLLTIALLHDAAETLLGDLPMSATRLLGAEAKHRAERTAIAELFGALPQGQEYMEIWEEYTQRSSREARLVKALDRLEMLAQALAYERAGSKAMDEFWVDAHVGCDEFPLVQQLVEQLLAARDTLRGQPMAPNVIR